KQLMNLRGVSSPVPAATYASPVITPPACASSYSISSGSSLSVVPETLDILDPICDSGATAGDCGSAITLDIVCSEGTDGSLGSASFRPGGWPSEAGTGRGCVP